MIFIIRQVKIVLTVERCEVGNGAVSKCIKCVAIGTATPRLRNFTNNKRRFSTQPESKGHNIWCHSSIGQDLVRRDPSWLLWQSGKFVRYQMDKCILDYGQNRYLAMNPTTTESSA
jgi:hypothetical protein